MSETVTTQPASPAQIAADAAKPVHKRVHEVETNEDGRAAIGRQKTVHRATITTDLNVYGESVGRSAYVSCGSKRYRNAGPSAGQASVVSQRYDVDCAKCLAV